MMFSILSASAMALAASLNYEARPPALFGSSTGGNPDAMSRRFTLLRREAAANANTAPCRTACRITSENRLRSQDSPETFLDAHPHWRVYIESTSARLHESGMVVLIVTCPSGRGRLVSHSSVTDALCVCCWNRW